MLELGKAGTSGVGKGVVPVLSGGALVASLRAENWREAATALVGDRSWVFAKEKGVLTGRWDVDPAGTARLRARQTSFWKGSWALDLDGVVVERENASVWKGTHRYTAGGRPVAETGTTGGWSPRPTLDADPSVPLPHQVFLLWVELVLSRRNTAVVAGAVGVAVVGGSS
ncbi:hypothetical protein E9549_09180 [Blastococcus sp. MG754426]|uniref:hypothetical protein n=1 Tax=unclassified Blastococcus TaxID=2619396 RepID=UPI001EF0384B|nr:MULTISPECIES: hypothetical protein [unclassified Blastococcus]MCF6507577.1 hypothetical protein [Blastococcus sp. MG754426]MCF6511969.1 hypothetical protein [Blastococcus sp. MG754427]MCF6735174.1 hypothetical protein [Blastococcus sp. KM273129]